MARNNAIEIDWSDIGDVTNDVYFPHYENRDKFLVLYGGSGTGKSHFAAQKIIYNCMCEEGHKVMAVRAVANTLRFTSFETLKDVVHVLGVDEFWKFTSTPMRAECTLNGSEIVFFGLDEEAKKIKSYNATMVWLEEADQILEEAYRECRRRMRAPKFFTGTRQMIITFNPVSIESWLKAEFFDRKEPSSTIIHTTYKDNQFLDEDYFKDIEASKERDPYGYTVYFLGEWGIPGGAIFSTRDVTERLVELREVYKDQKRAPKCGEFIYPYLGENLIDDSNIKFSEDSAGYIKIFREPEHGHPYIVAGDTAGEGEDYFAAHVIDNATGDQVASLHIQNIDEDEYAAQLYCLGRYYNDALITVETNFGVYTPRRLDQLGYPNQFVRVPTDTYTQKPQKRYGVKTTAANRRLMIAELVFVAREHLDWIWDTDTLSEMLTFVRNKKTGKPEAQGGKHDDLVMALSIAYYSRSQQVTLIDNRVEVDKSDIERIKDKRMKEMKRRNKSRARL